MKKSFSSESRVSLTRELVLRTALMIIDEKGIESFSMRQLGSKLGVEAMSLYNHIANKDDIIDGVLDLVIGEISIPAMDADWREAMIERAVSARGAFNRHPWASALIDTRVSTSPDRLRYFDNIIGTLHRAGFSFELAARAFSILDCYIYGFSRQKTNRVSVDDEDHEKKIKTDAEAFQKNIPAQSYPYLNRVTEIFIESGYDENADFEFGLCLILDGLERLLNASTDSQDTI